MNVNESDGCNEFDSLDHIFVDVELPSCAELEGFGDAVDFPTDILSQKAAAIGALALHLGKTLSESKHDGEHREPGSAKGVSSASSNQTDTATSIASGSKLVMPASHVVLHRLGPEALREFFSGSTSCGETVTARMPSPRRSLVTQELAALEAQVGNGAFSIHRLTAAAGLHSGRHSNASEKTAAKVTPGKCRLEDVDWTKIEDPEERKHQRRMAKNRHTAAVSRERRKNHFCDLEARVERLEQENASLKYWLGVAQRENVSLRGGPVSFVSGAGRGVPSEGDVQPTPVTSGGTSEPAEFLAKLQPVPCALLARFATVLFTLVAFNFLGYSIFHALPESRGRPVGQ